VGRRFSAGIAAVAIALALTAAACGNAQPANPYATLDRAITVGWQQVTLNLGVSIDVPAQQLDPDFTSPATSIHIDPAMIQASIDTQTGRWRFATSIPLGALGVDPQQLGPLGLTFQSVDFELLYDGAAYYAKSPLLPIYLQGILAGSGNPIVGDLTGWVRLGTAEEFAQVAGSGILQSIFGARLGGGPGVALPLPSAGSPEALQALIEDFGIALVGAGRESTDGLETEHVTATLNLAKLAESRTLATLTGFGRDQLQGIFDAANQVAITADLWADTSTGRLRTLRIDGHSLSAPITTVAIVLQLKEPAAGTTFDAPSTFADVPLLQLMGASFGGGDPTPILETFEIVGP